MNNFRASGTFRLVLFMLAASAAVFLSAHAGRTQTQTPNTKTRSATTWEWSDDGWRRRVEVHGKAEFAEDYSDISSLSEDGFVRIEEDHNGESRRLEVKRDESGQLLRKYLVDGEPRALDEKGRKWVAELLLNAVRQGAIDVDKRVQMIVRQRGVNGLLEEIGNISGDYGSASTFSRSSEMKISAARIFRKRLRRRARKFLRITRGQTYSRTPLTYFWMTPH